MLIIITTSKYASYDGGHPDGVMQPGFGTFVDRGDAKDQATLLLEPKRKKKRRGKSPNKNPKRRGISRGLPT